MTSRPRRRRRWVEPLPDVAAAAALRSVDDGWAARLAIPAALHHPDRDVRREAIYVLGNQYRSVRFVGPVLARIVGDPARAAMERGFAADSMARIVFVGRSATTVLLRALADPDVEVRFWAAFALGEVGDLRALEPLAAATTDTAVLDRWQSVGREARDAIATFHSRPIGRARRRARRRG